MRLVRRYPAAICTSATLLTSRDGLSRRERDVSSRLEDIDCGRFATGMGEVRDLSAARTTCPRCRSPNPVQRSRDTGAILARYWHARGYDRRCSQPGALGIADTYGVRRRRFGYKLLGSSRRFDWRIRWRNRLIALHNGNCNQRLNYTIQAIKGSKRQFA